MNLKTKVRTFPLKDKKIKLIFNVNTSDDANCQDLSSLIEKISENTLYFSQEVTAESISHIESVQVMLYGLGQWKTFDITVRHPDESASEPTQTLSFEVENLALEVFRKELLLAKTI